jgi:spore maturation protein CgeB
MRRLFPDEFTRLGRPVIAPVPADTPLSGLKVLVDYPIYGGSHTTATYIENALRELGCQVEGIDNAYADPLLQRILAVRDSSRSGNMAGKLTELLSDLYLAKWEAFQPHVAIFTAQSPITVGALRTVRSTSATAFWFVEDYRRFGYWRDYAREFDVFAGIQKGRFFEELLRCGCPNPIYLPMAADPNLHKPTPLSPDEERFFGADVVFMGAGYPNRHALLTELADLNLKVWGTGWEGNPRLAPFIAKSGQRVTIEESVKIFNATRINLNLHSSMESGYFEADGDFLNPRTFEIMACGGFQLTDSRSLLPELFTNGREIVTFGSLQELRDKTAYYLAHPAERKQIAEAGRRRVLAEHTYTHRLRTLLSAVLSRRPDISKQAVEKTRQTENALSRIADPELERFLRDIPAEKRDSLHDLAEAAHNGSGTLKWHEAMILALETFAGED